MTNAKTEFAAKLKELEERIKQLEELEELLCPCCHYHEAIRDIAKKKPTA